MARREIPWLRVVTEGVVIVVSILLAFAIDAWWDRHVDRQERQELIAALQQDFAATRRGLADAIAMAETSLEASRAYADAVRTDADITTDSLRTLFSSAFDGVLFQPTISNYEGAVSSGALAEISTPELMRALARFDAGRSWWLLHLRVLGDTHYGGPTWELRKILGSDDVVMRPETAPPAFRMPGPELRELITSRQAYAAMEVHTIIFVNALTGFRMMDEGAEQAIQAMEAMQAR